MRTATSCLHRFRSAEGLLWGAEPRFELGPALQQADALQFAPRRTLNFKPQIMTQPLVCMYLRLNLFKKFEKYLQRF